MTPGQHIPVLQDAGLEEGYDRKFYFDKVLVDAPCSGDGAVRKIPSRWREWSTADGREMHAVQIGLLMKALQMTRIGGVVVYSTCSLNDIEVGLCDEERGRCGGGLAASRGGQRGERGGYAGP